MNKSTIATIAVLVAWGAVAVTLAARGAYVSPAKGAPWPLIVSVIIPPLLFIATMILSPGARRWVSGSNSVFITSLQSWRILGGVFLVAAWFGHLPWQFALPAGLGDMAIGIATPFVIDAMRRRSPSATLALYALTIAGLLDFVVAVGSGTLVRVGAMASADPTAASLMTTMDQLPLVIIPAFFVPAFAIAHIAGLMGWINRDG